MTDVSKLYEELRRIIDGGSESFTHDDAVQYLKDRLNPVAHWSDCAVHSEPAYPKGECDCGGYKPEQEPIGVMVSMDVSKDDEPENRIFGRIYEVQEDADGVTYLAIEESRNFITQPQRTQVDLTDEEVLGLFGKFTSMTGKGWLDLYRMTEAKRKEKL